MLTPNQALEQILTAARSLSACKTDVRKSSGFVLASDVKSRDDSPRFDNSAMDGYAVRASDIRAASEQNPVSLRVIGEVHAGSPAKPKIARGTAARISTGAKVPPGADAVVMQEDCERNGNIVLVKDFEPRGGNIRHRGEEISKGEIALRRGTLLNPGSVAWLGSMGITSVSVHRAPRVGLLRSGNEVVELGKTPKPFQVRDAHGVSLVAALEQIGVKAVMPAIVKDDLTATVRAFKRLLTECDVIITTGGVSVGERDLFHEALRQLGVRTVFHGIAQKPGKPIAFGRRGEKLWFGLPGNPVSSLVCFYLYVQPALLKMMGCRNPKSKWFEARAFHEMRTDAKKAVFARGTLCEGEVSLAEKQGSHCLGSFAEANVLVRLEPSEKKIAAGETVRCTWLP